jgi:hypothetical protein
MKRLLFSGYSPIRRSRTAVRVWFRETRSNFFGTLAKLPAWDGSDRVSATNNRFRPMSSIRTRWDSNSLALGMIRRFYSLHSITVLSTAVYVWPSAYGG